MRRENEQRFEARVPLIPVHIQQLQQQLGDRIQFSIQPSEIRVFSNKAYQEVGVEISEDLSAADIILGVKEIYRDRW
ncbi:hypothetical protein HC928_23550 [bacterium]|nr:hypothetical protein [bacterium]